jgi:hypothetical protein
MKKLVLFLMVIGAVALMTSCLKGDNSYSNPGAFVFIDSSENGILHGRTSALPTHGPVITSSGIQSGMVGSPTPTFIERGRFYWIAYSWQKENEMTNLGGNMVADNVTIHGSVIEIDRGYLTMDEAPEIPEGVTPPPFINVLTPLFAGDSFWWRDNWIFEVHYTGGETPPRVNFDLSEISEHTSNRNITNIVINVRIDTPASSGTIGRRYRMAVDMSQLRREFQKQGDNHTLNIRLRYYQEGQTQTAIHTSEPFNWTLVRASGQ